MHRETQCVDRVVWNMVQERRYVVSKDVDDRGVGGNVGEKVSSSVQCRQKTLQF